MTMSPEWRYLGREMDLALGQICAGATALGKADHAEKGYYSQAFFGLSIGIERLAKLNIIADFAIKNRGAYPSNGILRKLGHDLGNLLDQCAHLSTEYRVNQEFSQRPVTQIHESIVAVLTDFAKRTRYYNLDYITGGAANAGSDPIEAWWTSVGEPILLKHYPAKRKDRDIKIATVHGRQIDPIATILYHREDGSEMTDMASVLTRGYESRVVGKYGRLYSLQIVRWLAYLLYDLSYRGGYDLRIEGLFGLYESVVPFMQPDSQLLRKVRWP